MQPNTWETYIVDKYTQFLTNLDIGVTPIRQTTMKKPIWRKKRTIL